MQTISIGYGKVNFDNMSANIAVFVVEPAFARTFPSTAMGRKGKMQMFPATQQGDIAGKMLMDTLECPDGKTLLITSQHRFRGSPQKDGAVFLSTRSTGPMLTVTASLPVHRSSVLGDSFLVFQGRGDLMGAEAIEKRGILPTHAWTDAFLDPEEVDQCFTIHELQAEIAPRPRVETVVAMSGKVIEIPGDTRRRQIKVR